MKRLTLIVSVAILAIGTGLVMAEEISAGPKGGRILEKTTPKSEFFVENDHTATVTFYGDDMKRIAPSEQTVTVVADSKEGSKRSSSKRRGMCLSARPGCQM